LLIPSRSEGNTSFYTDEDLENLETILSLTRDLGVNLAGVEIILNMRKRMEEMQKEMQDFVKYIEKEFKTRTGGHSEEVRNAIVRVVPPHLIRTQRTKDQR
jgi:MerR family transcriptional regulator/heat shock protein HspR